MSSPCMCVWGVEREGSAWRNYESRRAKHMLSRKKHYSCSFIHSFSCPSPEEWTWQI